jgi:hypothetical protein
MGKPNQSKDVELRPDAWARFERAVDVVAKSPPQHRRKSVAHSPKRKRKAVKKAVVKSRYDR